MKKLIISILAIVACIGLTSCKDKRVVVYQTYIRPELPKAEISGDSITVKLREYSDEFKIVNKWTVRQVLKCLDGSIGSQRLDSTVVSDTLFWIDYGGGMSRWVSREEKAKIDYDIAHPDVLEIDSTGGVIYFRWGDSGK